MLFSLTVATVNAQDLEGDSGASLVIDDFPLPLPRLEARDVDGMFPVRAGLTANGFMLGGELDALLVLDGVETPGDAASFEMSNGRAVFSQDDSSMGHVLLIWDGVDGDPVRTVANSGPGGGTDLTHGGVLDGFDFEIARNDLPLQIGLLLLTGLENVSEQVLDVPVINEPLCAACWSFSAAVAWKDQVGSLVEFSPEPKLRSLFDIVERNAVTRQVEVPTHVRFEHLELVHEVGRQLKPAAGRRCDHDLPVDTRHPKGIEGNESVVQFQLSAKRFIIVGEGGPTETCHAAAGAGHISLPILQSPPPDLIEVLVLRRHVGPIERLVS